MQRSRGIAACCGLQSCTKTGLLLQSPVSSPHITWGACLLHRIRCTTRSQRHMDTITSTRTRNSGRREDPGSVLITLNSLSRCHAGGISKNSSRLPSISGASTTNQSHFLRAHVQARFGICTCHRQSSLRFPSWRTIISCFAPCPKYIILLRFALRLLHHAEAPSASRADKSSRPHAQPEARASCTCRLPPATYNATMSHPIASCPSRPDCSSLC